MSDVLSMAALTTCGLVGGVVAVRRSLGVCAVPLLASQFDGRRAAVTAPSEVDGGITADPTFSARFLTSVESDLVVPRSLGVGRFAGTGRRLVVES